MGRILQHEPPDETGCCPICGTTAVQIANGYTCIWRDAPDARTGGLAPEPTRRVPACEDQDTISRRLAELRQEQEAAWNAAEQ